MKKNNKGFSLVELVVVIAIMAVLVVVLAPAYLRYVDKTRLQKDVAAVGEVINAVKVAAAEEEVLEQLTHETEKENLWTYIKIEKGTVAQSRSAGDEVQSDKNTIVVGSLVVGKDVTAVQGAVDEIIGSTIDFKRQEVKDARLYIVFAYDDNFNIIAKVDTSCFADYPDVKVAFDAAFDTTAEATGANKIANLTDRINDFTSRYDQFKEENATLLAEAEASQTKINELQALVDVAGNYEEYQSAIDSANAALTAAQQTATEAAAKVEELQTKYDAAPKYSREKAQLFTELGLAKTAAAAAEEVIPGLQTAVTNAENELKAVKAAEQENKDSLAAEQENYNTNYKEVVDQDNAYQEEGWALAGEAGETAVELGVDNITSEEFWNQFGGGSNPV